MIMIVMIRHIDSTSNSHTVVVEIALEIVMALEVTINQ